MLAFFGLGYRKFSDLSPFKRFESQNNLLRVNALGD
jgi:hypothetical protein